MSDERLVMAIHRTRRTFADSEPVLISVSQDGRVELTISEGDAWEFDVVELRSALDQEAA
jgi:hypothetical protein